MIYLLAFLIGFFFIIYFWNSVIDTSEKVILTVIMMILCLFIAFLINGIVAINISPTDISETEVPVYTNPVTNQYYLINSKGKLIETDNYEISPEVNKLIGIEKEVKYDMGIWGMSETDTEYRILIPLERE